MFVLADDGISSVFLLLLLCMCGITRTLSISTLPTVALRNQTHIDTTKHRLSRASKRARQRMARVVLPKSFLSFLPSFLLFLVAWTTGKSKNRKRTILIHNIMPYFSSTIRSMNRCITTIIFCKLLLRRHLFLGRTRIFRIR